MSAALILLVAPVAILRFLGLSFRSWQWLCSVVCLAQFAYCSIGRSHGRNRHRRRSQRPDGGGDAGSAAAGRCWSWKRRTGPAARASPRPLTLPGYLHDVGAAFFPFADYSPAFRSLDLTGAGLHWVNAHRESCHPAPDGIQRHHFAAISEQTVALFRRRWPGVAAAGAVAAGDGRSTGRGAAGAAARLRPGLASGAVNLLATGACGSGHDGELRASVISGRRRPGASCRAWPCTSIWDPTTSPAPALAWCWRCWRRGQRLSRPGRRRRVDHRRPAPPAAKRPAARFGSNARVEQILVRDGRVVGVRTQSGEEIRGRTGRARRRRTAGAVLQLLDGRPAAVVAAPADAAFPLRLGHVQDGLGAVRPGAVDGGGGPRIGRRPRRRQPRRPASASRARSAPASYRTIPIS